MSGVPSPRCNLRRPASPDDAPELLRAWLGPLMAALPATACLPLSMGPDPAALGTTCSPDAPGIRIPRSESPPVWRAASPPSSRVGRVASTAVLRRESSQRNDTRRKDQVLRDEDLLRHRPHQDLQGLLGQIAVLPA